MHLPDTSRTPRILELTNSAILSGQLRSDGCTAEEYAEIVYKFADALEKHFKQSK